LEKCDEKPWRYLFRQQGLYYLSVKRDAGPKPRAMVVTAAARLAGTIGAGAS
jgi:hypothetical protein